MEKPNRMALSTLVILAGSSLILPSVLQFAAAQYSAGDTTPGSIEEQLNLAKEKISNAKQTGAYGSGTPMLGTNISETVIFIGVMVAIFGGVAAAFFYRSRTARKATA
jgi:precorrin-4 methylase